MKKNSKISVALHALVHLNQSRKGPMTSEELGSCLRTNPVVIRKVLGKLKKSGIVLSEKGHGGGWKILKAPSKISFLDVYTSLDLQILPWDEENIDEGCVIADTLQGTLNDFLREANVLLEIKLKKIKLSNIIELIQNCN